MVVHGGNAFWAAGTFFAAIPQDTELAQPLIRLFTTKFNTDVHGTQRMNPVEFDDFLTFNLGPPAR